ncbi:hypothetical protein CathTA2_1924 [Caldalkalibacillus thermarum TA2.A1]|uniref:DUF3870 domain-containing protein n=1 Tax=Caldalkalibacillus thermarum (strain TA2.A1) TaxID=986075 RepID=F5L7X4_CALTT|nr:DUF3870 domain-containing protein [Caldalkalibacillus thermarum]EGL82562.1 hypothetical protein CathTA2_1924 [Caldalkalibacillus thermarum TA2.A1]QZT34788.1 DUF3870 domain-containing protein [Caldalkalibacillus thermarum TA2.A1]GGK17733.1 hypothetical protein GCM10010965_08420 [Caldalkalibacillus thermarum]
MAKIIMLAGHAKLPQGMAAKSVYETLTITAEVEEKYGVIIDASCTLATAHAQEFLGRLLRGCSLQDGVEELVERIQTYYHGKAQQALIAAIKDLHRQFHHYRERTV